MAAQESNGWITNTGRRDRLSTLAGVGLAHLAVLLLFLTGSPEGLQRIAEQPMQLITIRPSPPPPAPAKPPAARARPRKTSSALTKRPPPTNPPPPVPGPVAVAAVADTDLSASVGSGVSFGSIGTGLNLGGDVGGGGAGGGGGLAHPAEWVGGGIGNRDYPEAAKRARLQGVVDVLFTVHTDGRVSGCKVDHSSGSPDLDRLTCALTERRLLYNPALDASGKPIEEIAGRRFRFVMSPRRERRVTASRAVL